MKKRMMLLLAMILTVLTLAACGGSKISPVVGNWKATTVSVSGVSVDVDEYLKQSGNEDVKMEMVLEKDNTMSINMAGQTGEGTWKLDGSTLTPVSYTHLDVYKRQIFSCVVRRLRFSGLKTSIICSPMTSLKTVSVNGAPY